MAHEVPATSHWRIARWAARAWHRMGWRHVPGSTNPIGSVRVQSIALDMGYFFADHWSVHLGIPFVESVYRGPAPHCPTNDPPQCKGKVVPNRPSPSSSTMATTGSSLGEANGDTYVGYSGGSVTRKPGSLLVTQHSEFGNKTLRATPTARSRTYRVRVGCPRNLDDRRTDNPILVPATFRFLTPS